MALPTLGVLDKDEAPQTINTLNSGRQAAADSSAVVLSTEDKADLSDIKAATETVATATQETDPTPVRGGSTQYQWIAASQTEAGFGTAGALGDYLEGFHIIPTGDPAGAVTLHDGENDEVVFAGGSIVVPVTIGMGVNSLSGGWAFTTGANLKLLVIGSPTNA